MADSEKCLLAIRGIGDDKYYNRTEIFPGNLYELLLDLDLTRIQAEDNITIIYEELNGFDENGLIGVKVVPDGKNDAAVTSSILLHSESEIVFEVFNGSVIISSGKKTIEEALDLQSTLTLPREVYDGNDKVSVHIFLRSVPLKVCVDKEYNTLETPDDEDLDFPLHEGATIMIKVKNTGDRIERGTRIAATLTSPALEYIQGTTNIVGIGDNVGFKNNPSDSIIKKDGILIGDLRPSDEIAVDFDVKLSQASYETNTNTLPINIYVWTDTARLWSFNTYLNRKLLEETHHNS